MFIEYSKKYPITSFSQLGNIWYDIPKVIREDIRSRIFDCLMSGNSPKDHYILRQLEVAYECAEYTKVNKLQEQGSNK